MKPLQDFMYEIGVEGYSIFEDVVPDLLLERLRTEIPERQRECQAWQRKNGLTEGMEGAAHHIVGGGGSLDEFLYSLFLHEYIAAFFEGRYILNSFGALINYPYSAATYEHGHRFHRDVRTFSHGFHLMLNMLVMIDEFSSSNGATRVVPGTHRVKEKPPDAYLQRNAVSLIGSAGSIVLFDSNLWHSAAPNLTQKPRIALTPSFSRPFFKQQLDFPRFLGADFPKNEEMRQLLGYNAQVPANYDEWYRPPDERKYKSDQG